jgi:hypothetical protein
MPARRPAPNYEVPSTHLIFLTFPIRMLTNRMVLTRTHYSPHRRLKANFQSATVAHLKKVFSEAAKAGIIPKQNYEAAGWATVDVVRGVIARKVLSNSRLAEEDAAFLTEVILHAVQIRK